MARNYKQPSIVSGMSVSDILGMDFSTFNKLGSKEMRLVVGRLTSAANKRIRRMEAADTTSPAYNQIMRSGGYISTKGKGLNALRAEFMRAKNFMESRTSSLTGYKQVKKETSSTLREYGVDIPPEKLGDAFSIYDRLKEIDPSIANKAFKYRVLYHISKLPGNMDFESKVESMSSRLVEIYEEGAEREQQDGVSEFFEFE